VSYAAVTAGWTALLLAGAVGAAWLLRRSWGDRTVSRPWWIAAGWAIVAVLVVVASLTLGSGRGPFIAFTVVSVASLAVVAANVQLREARVRGDKSLAPEPSDRVSKAWRGWLRGLLAGPLGMIAAMGVAICFSAFCPGAAQTRLVIGGLMVPVLWGAAMAWTLADDKILRATAVLVGVSVVTFTAAILRGFS
jgi:F0F1-type ATP synthase membrane subunit c/vacuolar-type H+-ATPase subunit K